MFSFYHLWGLNPWLFFLINGIRGDLLDRFMLLGSLLGDFINFPWLLALIGLVLVLQVSPYALPSGSYLPQSDSLKRFLLEWLLGCLLAAMVVLALKQGLQMPRPALAFPASGVNVVGPHETSYSFPSGHACYAMLLVVTLWPRGKWRSKILLAIYAVWVGVSRVSLGAHFPVDVLAGYLCGGLSAHAVRFACGKIRFFSKGWL